MSTTPPEGWSTVAKRTRAAARQNELRYLILAAQREGNRMLASALRELDLTPAQAEVLDVLSGREPVTLATLGRLLVCEAGSPSRLVDTLVRRGLLTREPAGDDRRTVLISLTTQGKAVAGQFGAAASPVTAVIAERLRPEEIDTLIALLHQLMRDTSGGDAIRQRFAPH